MTKTLSHRIGYTLIASVLMSGPAIAADALSRLDLRQVKVGGEIGRRIDITVKNNLLAFDADKVFLAPFREKPANEVYIGLGKFIDSLSRLAAYTNDDKVLALRKQVIDATLAMQEADGYIGIMKPEQRVWGLWDIHEMSYIIYGLCTDAQLFDHAPSSQAARKLADFIISKLQASADRPPTQYGIMLHVALTGFEQALIRLSEQTGESKYRDFTIGYRKLPEWEHPIRLGRSADIANHAYSYLARCMAQLRLYRVTSDPRLLARSKGVMEFLTRGDGMAITGTCGDHECWHNTQAGTVNLGETCTTAYLLRWLDEQLRLTGDAGLGDIMERTVYNALFAAQSPDGRQIRYYSPFDGPRTYFPKDSYCCPNNFRRAIAELPQMVYYAAPDGVLVNLYTASQAEVKLPDGGMLKLRQETDYPTSGKVVIALDPQKPAGFSLKLRIPRWCDTAKAVVNGGALTLESKGGNLLAISRVWSPGDRVELDMPMSLRLIKGRVNQAGRFAVMHGPTLFCLNAKSNPALAKMDLRLLVAWLPTLKGPVKDESVRPDGLACTLNAWSPGAWYPAGEPSIALKLTEFPDPDGVATYFFLPDPADPRLVDDELFSSR